MALFMFLNPVNPVNPVKKPKNMKKEYCFSYDSLLKFCDELFRNVGLNKEHSTFAAESICSASLNGVDSHGIRLLPHYIKEIEAGRIDTNAKFDFKKTSVSTGILDANHGVGHAAVSIAMDNAIKLASNSGVGFVSVKNSNHCGAMAYYAKRACEHDMIGLAFTNATPKLKTFNANDIFFGLNPICFAAPMKDEEPFCYDAAPSIMSNNKIKLFAENNELLPDNIAVDKDGKITTDPNLVKMLLPIGGTNAGYKGFGLAMLVDILCSLLSGMPNGKDVTAMYEKDGGNLSEKRYSGQFVGAIRIDVFEDVDKFKTRLKETADNIRKLKKSDNATDEVMVAGDPEKKCKAERLKNGIPIPKNIIEFLKQKNLIKGEL